MGVEVGHVDLDGVMGRSRGPVDRCAADRRRAHFMTHRSCSTRHVEHHCISLLSPPNMAGTIFTGDVSDRISERFNPVNAHGT